MKTKQLYKLFKSLQHGNPNLERFGGPMYAYAKDSNMNLYILSLDFRCPDTFLIKKFPNGDEKNIKKYINKLYRGDEIYKFLDNNNLLIKVNYESPEYKEEYEDDDVHWWVNLRTLHTDKLCWNIYHLQYLISSCKYNRCVAMEYVKFNDMALKIIKERL